MRLRDFLRKDLTLETFVSFLRSSRSDAFIKSKQDKALNFKLPTVKKPKSIKLTKEEIALIKKLGLTQRKLKELK